MFTNKKNFTNDSVLVVVVIVVVDDRIVIIVAIASDDVLFNERDTVDRFLMTYCN